MDKCIFLMIQYIQDNGRKDSFMELALINGQMVISTSVSIEMVKKMERVHFTLKIRKQNLLDHGLIIT